MKTSQKSSAPFDKSRLLITTAVLLSISLTACNREQPKANAAPPEVQTTQVVQQDVPITSEWLGTLDGSTNVEIRSHVNGYLMAQKYTDGAAVKKGDILFIIDSRPFEAQLAQAQAQLGLAQAQQQKSDLEFQKQKDLFAKKVTSQRDFDDANQINLANIANVAAAQAVVQQAQLNLDFTKITAPIDGVAGIAQVGIGDLLGPGSGVLTTISTVDPIKAKFPLSEQEYLYYSKAITTLMDKTMEERKAGASLVLADGTVFAEKGKFFTVGREVDVRTGTILVEVLFPNPGSILRPGQFAKVRAVLETQKDALLVPQRSVAEMQGSYSVAVIGVDNKAEIRPVKVGERTGAWWVIGQGLKPGEQVVVEGLQKVRNDVPVTVKPWTPPSPAFAAPEAPKPDAPAAQPETK